MKTRHENEVNHNLAKEAYEITFVQKYEESNLYHTYSKLIDKIIRKRNE